MQGILLAAGFGRRFNAGTELQQDKLLTTLANSGKPILWHSANALITALPNSIAVVQPRQTARQKVLHNLGFKVIESARAKEGMGYALADAINASNHSKGWLIALADMPWIAAELMQQVSAKITDPESIAAPRFNGKRGQPVAFGVAWAKQLATLQGDAGARELLKTSEINWVDWHDESIHRDVDTAHDLKL